MRVFRSRAGDERQREAQVVPHFFPNRAADLGGTSEEGVNGYKYGLRQASNKTATAGR